MTAKITKNVLLPVALYHEQQFVINTYDIEIIMNIITEDVIDQNIALQRIDYIIYESLQNCILINKKYNREITLYNSAKIKVVLLPNEPYEQIVAAVLLKKLNAIADERYVVYTIKISSVLSDGMSFFVTEEDHPDLDDIATNWWNDPSPSIHYFDKRNRERKVVELKKKSLDWSMLGLGWHDSIADAEKPHKGEVVFISTDHKLQ